MTGSMKKKSTQLIPKIETRVSRHTQLLVDGKTSSCEKLKVEGARSRWLKLFTNSSTSDRKRSETNKVKSNWPRFKIIIGTSQCIMLRRNEEISKWLRSKANEKSSRRLVPKRGIITPRFSAQTFATSRFENRHEKTGNSGNRGSPPFGTRKHIPPFTGSLENHALRNLYWFPGG